MFFQFLNLFSFITTIGFNYGTIKGFGPFHSITNVSNTYKSILTPPNWTFSIWGVIYSALAIFIISSFILKNKFQPIINNIGSLFSISCMFNVLWLLVFSLKTRESTLGSVFIIVGLLITLVLIQIKGKLFRNSNLKTGKEKIAKVFCIDIPLSLYLGWIIFATIANVGNCLSSWGINTNDYTVYFVLFSIAMFLYTLNLVFYGNYVTQLVFLYVITGFLIKFSNNKYQNSIFFKFTFGIGLFSLIALISKIIIDICQRKKTIRKKMKNEKYLYTPTTYYV